MIPSPKKLMEIVQSTKRVGEDREWKKYQRYLEIHEQEFGNPPTKQPISFEKYCG